mgnify:CR=1 FL=1
MNILTALGQLDSLNNDHWTGDGSPAMKALEAIMEDSSVTRKQVTEAAPLFTRSNPTLPEISDDEGTGVSSEEKTDDDGVTGDGANQSNSEAAQAGSGDAQEGSTANGEATTQTAQTLADVSSSAPEIQPELNSTDDDDDVDVIRERYEAKQEEIAETRRQLEEGKKFLKGLEKDEAELHDRLILLDPPMTNQEMIRRSINASNKQRLVDSESRAKLLAALPKGSKVNAGFPVDEPRQSRHSTGMVNPLRG